MVQVRRNIESRQETVIDARGAGRFAGVEAEPRAGVRSGHIPNSLNVPFTQVQALQPNLVLKPLYFNPVQVYIKAGVSDFVLHGVILQGSRPQKPWLMRCLF